MTDTAATSLGILDRLVALRKLGIQAEALARLFLIECELDIALLSALALDDAALGQAAPAFVSVGRQLRIDTLEAVLGLDDVAAATYRALGRAHLRLPEDYEVDGPDGGWLESAPASVAERLRRLYVSAVSCRQLCETIASGAATPGTDGFRAVRLRTRLANLRLAYIEIAAALRAHLGITG